jgi:hypothetical protein
MEIKGMMLPWGHILQTNERSQRETNGFWQRGNGLCCRLGLPNIASAMLSGRQKQNLALEKECQTAIRMRYEVLKSP